MAIGDINFLHPELQMGNAASSLSFSDDPNSPLNYSPSQTKTDEFLGEANDSHDIPTKSADDVQVAGDIAGKVPTTERQANGTDSNSTTTASGYRLPVYDNSWANQIATSFGQAFIARLSGKSRGASLMAGSAAVQDLNNKAWRSKYAHKLIEEDGVAIPDAYNYIETGDTKSLTANLGYTNRIDPVTGKKVRVSMADAAAMDATAKAKTQKTWKAVGDKLVAFDSDGNILTDANGNPMTYDAGPTRSEQIAAAGVAETGRHNVATEGNEQTKNVNTILKRNDTSALPKGVVPQEGQQKVGGIIYNVKRTDDGWHAEAANKESIQTQPANPNSAGEKQKVNLTARINANLFNPNGTVNTKNTSVITGKTGGFNTPAVGSEAILTKQEGNEDARQLLGDLQQAQSKQIGDLVAAAHAVGQKTDTAAEEKQMSSRGIRFDYSSDKALANSWNDYRNYMADRYREMGLPVPSEFTTSTSQSSAQSGSSTSSGSNTIKAGFIDPDSGMIFLGGDPSNKANWHPGNK